MCFRSQDFWTVFTQSKNLTSCRREKEGVERWSGLVKKGRPVSNVVSGKVKSELGLSVRIYVPEYLFVSWLSAE